MNADLIAAIVDEGLGNSSYLVDLGDRRALVVDPERDPAPYLAAAADRRLRLAYAAETHLHADFVSGSRELAAGGAKVLAAAAGRTAFPHRGLDDGTEVDLGGLTLRALATPEHTPEQTIGAERATNPLLGAPSEDAFVASLLAGLGTYPPYFSRLRELNRRGPAVYGPEPSALAHLDPGQVRSLADDGAAVVDVRPIAAFAAGHIPGSLSIPLRDQFATWLGWLVAAGRPLVVVLDPFQDRAEVVRQAYKIGYEHLAGELAGGMVAWNAAGLPSRRVRLVPAAQAAGTVLDVRQDAEDTAGHIPGAVHVELGSVGATGIPAGGPLTLMCGHGERAMTAASILEAAGHHDLRVMVGGAADWAAASGRPLQTGR